MRYYISRVLARIEKGTDLVTIYKSHEPFYASSLNDTRERIKSEYNLPDTCHVLLDYTEEKQ